MTLKCYDCGQAVTLDKAKFSKVGQSKEQKDAKEYRNGYREQCPKCGADYTVRLNITGMGTAQEKAEVKVVPVADMPTAVHAANLSRVADAARAAAVAPGGAADQAVAEQMGGAARLSPAARAAAEGVIRKEAAQTAGRVAVAPILATRPKPARQAVPDQAAADAAIAKL